MSSIIRLTYCNNRIEAELIQSLLHSAGIESFVTADDVGGLYGFSFALSAAGGAQVMIAKADEAAARAVIASVGNKDT